MRAPAGVTRIQGVGRPTLPEVDRIPPSAYCGGLRSVPELLHDFFSEAEHALCDSGSSCCQPSFLLLYGVLRATYRSARHLCRFLHLGMPLLFVALLGTEGTDDSARDRNYSTVLTLGAAGALIRGPQTLETRHPTGIDAVDLWTTAHARAVPHGLYAMGDPPPRRLDLRCSELATA